MTLFNKDQLRKIEEREKKWLDLVKKETSRIPERSGEFKVPSGITVKRVYTPADLGENYDYFERLGFPGEYPFTRGIHTTMYRARFWTMRMFSGYGTPEDTNKRLKFLLSHGETGLSLAFDFPTLLGLDSDDPLSHGEVGVCGVAVDTLKDMEIIFDGIPMDKVTTNMTINPPAPILLAMYIAAAEKQGVPPTKIGGTTQNDNLKEFIAQKSYVFPPEAAVKLTLDVIEYSVRHVPRWNPISISGYHIREAGATAVEELALTLADGIEYVRAGVKRMDVDEFAPRLSFFFDSGMNFFEEIAKFRAARRMWAVIMRDWFGARKPRSMWLRFHTQTSGASLTAQQPENNIVRTAFEALAAVLGGTQSLHTNSYDEAWALPSDKAAKIALRTQQIIAYETGVADTVDPLAGSYFVEWLTDRVEEEAWRIIDRIESMGGMIQAIKKGYPQRIIAESAYRYQKELEEKKRIVVGVNMFVDPDEKLEIPILKINQPEVERRQIERLRTIRRERDNAKVKTALSNLRAAARRGENVMPYVLEAVKVYASLGEIMGVLKEVYGEWVEVPIF